MGFLRKFLDSSENVYRNSVWDYPIIFFLEIPSGIPSVISPEICSRILQGVLSVFAQGVPFEILPGLSKVSSGILLGVFFFF